MKKLFTLTALVFFTAAAFAQRLNTEDFNYAAGQLTDLNGGANVSSGAWKNSSGNAEPLQVVTGNLSYADYITNPLPGSGRLRMDTVTGSGEDAYMSFAAQNANTVYCSFLVNLSSTANLISHDSVSGDYFASFLPSTNTFSYACRLYIRNGGSANTFNLGIAAQSAANTPVDWIDKDFAINATHLVTMSYEFVTGSGNDIARLWVDYPYSAAEPAAQATSAYAGGSENANIGSLAVRQNYSSTSKGGTPKADLDAFKISTAWSDVSLPVRLKSFTASLSSNQPALKWITADEVNMKEYIVERSSDAKNFTAVARITAKNSTGENNYSYTDMSVLHGTVWYRINMVDNDGKNTYSNALSLTMKDGLQIKLKTNPVHDKLIVEHSEVYSSAKILIINNSGTIVVNQLLQSGDTETSINVSNLAAGNYYIVFENGNDRIAEQFIKQ